MYWNARSQCFAGLHDERGIALVLEHAGLNTLPSVEINAERILQVLGNLLHNALKFTEAGGMVRMSAAAADGAVITSVSDTGPGIGAEDLPRIFDRFWHARRRAKIRCDRTRTGHQSRHRAGARGTNLGGERAGSRDNPVVRAAHRFSVGGADLIRHVDLAL